MTAEYKSPFNFKFISRVGNQCDYEVEYIAITPEQQQFKVDKKNEDRLISAASNDPYFSHRNLLYLTANARILSPGRYRLTLEEKIIKN